MSVKGSLSSLFNPKVVCLVGASSNPERLTGRPLGILERHGYPGDVYVVNSRRDMVGSHATYPSVSSLPVTPDVALVMVPAKDVPGAIEECGVAGVQHAVVLSSGFEEVAGAEQLAADLCSAADRYDVNVVGPNSEGIWAVPSKLFLTFGSAAQRDVITPGPVSVVSQSGSIGGGILRSLERRGLGCRFFVSVGNESRMTTMDFLEYMVEEGGTKVILVFLEGLKDGERLKQISAAARSRGVQLVVLRGGVSSEGRAATATHTGKIASSSKVYSDVLAQCGVLQVESLESMVDSAEVLLAAPPIVRTGDLGGIGVMGISGGSRALVADACDTLNVPLATFSPETEASVKEIIPSYGYPRNPTDVTGQVLSDPAIFSHALNAIAVDPQTEALLVQYANRGPEQVREDHELLAAVVRETGKPVVVSFLGENVPDEVRVMLTRERIIPATGPDVAVRYLNWLYQADTASRISIGGTDEPAGGTRFMDDGRPPVGTALSHWQGQAAFLESCGVGVPRWKIVEASEAGTRLPDDLKFPVVVKAMPGDVAHKTELGLVRLDVRDDVDFAETIAEFRTALGDGKDILVQEMLDGGIEALLTVRDDPDFGPVLAVGSGGTLVELLDDLTYVSIPCDRATFSNALDRTHLRQLLSGFRGSKPKDRDALLDAMAAVSSAFLASRPGLKEIELNPFFVMDDGQGVCAVDVLVLSDEQVES